MLYKFVFKIVHNIDFQLPLKSHENFKLKNDLQKIIDLKNILKIHVATPLVGFWDGWPVGVVVVGLRVGA